MTPGEDDDPVPPDPEGPDDDDPGGEIEETPGSRKLYVSGVPVRIVSERIEYYGQDGRLITESYREFSREKVQAEFTSLRQFSFALEISSKETNRY